MRKFLILLTLLTLLFATKPEFAQDRHTAEICALCVRADLNFLASDELHGRGSGTRDEHLAALYAASLFQSFGLEPAGESGSYIERAPLPAKFSDGFEKYMKSKGF